MINGPGSDSKLKAYPSHFLSFICVSDKDIELYPQFSTRIVILEIETESSFHSGVNVSKRNCKIMESFNIYENTQSKKKQKTQIRIS